MSRTPRNAAERARIVDNALDTLTTLDIPELRDAIDMRIDDGLGAATYDGTRGGDDTSTPERLAVTHADRWSDRACEDLSSLDRALGMLAEADNMLNVLRNRYPIYDATADRTGLGAIGTPTGLCAEHWKAQAMGDDGRPVKAASGRYQSLCRKCGEHLAATGEPFPPEVLRAASEYGWDSWRVTRRLSAS